MSKTASTILNQNARGGFALGSFSHADLKQVDISDIDLVLTMKNGARYVLPGGGISAMQDESGDLEFSDGKISISRLLEQVGTAVTLSVESMIPSSERTGTASAKADEALWKRVHDLQQKLEEQQKQLQQQTQKIKEQHSQIDHQSHQLQQTNTHDAQTDGARHNLSTLNANSEASVEQMVQKVEKIQENLHRSDYDYVAPAQYKVAVHASSPPPGVPPPISMTPIVSLYMGNVVGTEYNTTDNPGYVTYYGGGGAYGSTSEAQLGPRNALQYSAAVIDATAQGSADCIIYAEGPLVGNATPATDHSTYYAKEFILNVAGYFTSLDDITIKNVPTGASIVGATDMGNGVWILPKSYVLKETAFTIVYNTSAYVAGGDNTFDIEFNISGMTTRHATFSSKQVFRFEYMPVTSVDQVTDPTLIWDSGGTVKEVYILPTADQPNIITAGDGNDYVYGGRSADTITLGNGDSHITSYSGNDIITVGNGDNYIVSGDGNNTITVGDGANSITVGAGTNVITTGDGANIIETGDGKNTISLGSGANFVQTGAGNDTITSTGGGGAIDAGAGNNAITVNSTSGSVDVYSIVTSGSGTNVIVGGDDNYDISMGAGTNTVTIGNSTSVGDGVSTFDTSIIVGAGTNTITTGSGVHNISVGAGTCSITTGDGSNTITTAGGGGSIVTGGGDETIIIDNSASSTDNYTVTTTGSGTTSLTAKGGNYTISVGSGANTISIGNGTSFITAMGAGINDITTGDGAMTIAAGAGDNVIQTGTGALSLTAGNGSNTVTATGGGGTIVLGSGGNSVQVGDGVYSITTGSGNDTIVAGDSNNTIDAGAGTNSTTVGNGNNTIVGGSGNDTIITGSGNNVIKAGLGTNVITGGSGSNTMDFSDITTTALTVTVGNGTTHGSATGTGVSDDFLNISSIVGTNMGDTITLTSGTKTVYAGSGNDAIYCGSSTCTIYAGNGNNTIYGGTGLAYLYGGTGNNTFLTPKAGTYYNGTNGAALANVANNVGFTISNTAATNPFANATNIPSTVSYTYSGGVATISLQLQVQLNKINYASDSSSLTVNLQNGTGSGGTAQGSTYAFYTTGYNTINYVVVGNGTDYITPSFSDSILVGGTGVTYFYDHNITLASQNLIVYGNSTASNGSWDYVYAGAAHETIVGTTKNYVEMIYGGTKGIVLNLDSVSHTFTSSLYSNAITVDAYSGSNWGANETNSIASFSTGDYFVPVSGTSTYVGEVYVNASIKSLVYGPNNYFVYYGNSGSDYLYGNTNVSSTTACYYYMSYGNDVFVGGSGMNIFMVNPNNSHNIFTILSKSVEATAYTNGWITAAQFAKDNAVSLSYGGTTYTEFAYGWNNVTTPSGNPKTYMSGVEYVVGNGGSDFIIGDNNGNQINARAGSNFIVEGSGTNTITMIEGSNTLYSTGTSNILNFETVNNSYSGVLASQSATATIGVSVFLNNATETTFFNTGTGGDQAAFWGTTAYDAFQVHTGTPTGGSYSTVQSGIVSTINGGDYSSGTSVSTGNSTFTYDHVYSGASTIYAHGGNSIFLDNLGTSSETFYGGARSDVYYLTPEQVSHVSIVDTVGSYVNTLRVPGWGNTSTSGNAFGATDPFSGTTITGINVIDVRSGSDTVTTSSTVITMGSNSSTHSGPVFNLSAQDVVNVTGVSSSPALYLKLDNGETFTPTGTVDTVVSGSTTTWYNSTTHDSAHLIATQTHTASNYYSDVIVYNSGNNAHLNIHYGSG